MTPYFASCANSEDNYLFVPSGSGALMYTNETADGTRKYTQEVYGIDAAKKVLTYYADEAAASQAALSEAYTGVNAIVTPSKVEFYNLNGMQVTEPNKGVNIRISTGANGQRIVEKVLVK